MSEHKQASMRRDMARLLAHGVSKRLADEGRLVEAGAAAFEIIFLAKAGHAQRSDMRMAFMAGAQHLFASIISVLDPDAEPTAEDMRRMTLLDAELKVWEKRLEAAFDARFAGST